jgi:GNAT superfamily N-acetyltransferase
MEMGVTVRRVRFQDAARMRALRLEMLADTPLAFLETLAEAAALPHKEFADRVARNAVGPLSAQFVAEVDGHFVGHAGGIMSPDDRTVTIIFAVYITPAHRGTGILKQLIDEVAAWSRTAGRPELMLEVVVGNDRARKAYERLGFVDTGVRVPHPVIPTLRELRMLRPA